MDDALSEGGQPQPSDADALFNPIPHAPRTRDTQVSKPTRAVDIDYFFAEDIEVEGEKMRVCKICA
jgi:hypothetical protein